MHPAWLSLLALALALGGNERTIITKAGERVTGVVTRSGTDYLVETLAGKRRLPEAEVAVVFEDVKEVLRRADDRYQEAKRLYEEAVKLEESDPLRNHKLGLAIELSQDAATQYRILEPHYRGDAYASIPRTLQVILQFVRLCRGASSSTAAGATTGGKPGTVAVEEIPFKFEPPPAAAPAWKVDGELGPGLGAIGRDLLNPDDARRLEAVKRLAHPPAPGHYATLLELFQREKNPEIVSAIVPALAFMDSGPLLKSIAWVRRDPNPLKKSHAFGLLRAAGDRAACDFLIEWFVEAVPAADADRAAFASAFRHLRANAVPLLRELLTKNRNPKVQAEVIKQLGVIGDKSAGPMILRAMPAYTRDAVVSLIKLGKPGLPTLVEGARSNDAETRRICTFLCRKTTGVQGINVSHFENWWKANGKAVTDEEKAWWEAQEKKGYAVEPADFAQYEMPIESFIY